MSQKKDTQKSTASAAKGKPDKGLSAEERSAMKERLKELKGGKVDGESAVQGKLAELTGMDRVIGERIHALITANAPSLQPKLWYGMPAYANKNGKVVCFFQPAQKFDTRYATLGFNDTAALDDGSVWPVAYGIAELTAADEAKISALVKKAAGD